MRARNGTAAGTFEVTGIGGAYSGGLWPGSMTAVTLIVPPPDNFEVLSGQTVRYDRKADSGNVIAMNFCAHCHGWLWSDPARPGIKVARAGTLDNMDWAAASP